MANDLNAEVISIGTEILLGELTDTNSVYIARVLRDMGINLFFMTSVGDNEQRIANAIQNALDRATVVITCGGLGPTVDDMTRQAVAQATGRGLTFHQNLLDQITERFAGFRVKMTENNRRQAFLPDNAIAVENPVGTAPAFIVEHEDKLVISLPGVPREMKFLMTEKIIPYLTQRYTLGIIKAHTLKTAGIGESALDEMLGSDLLGSSNPSIGLAAHSGQIDVRITAKAATSDEAQAMIDTMTQQVLERAGRFIFGANADRLEYVLVSYMDDNAYRVALAEVGIGAEINNLLRAHPKGEAVIATSVIAPNIDHLHLDSTVPLQECARTYANTLRTEAGATASIVVLSNPDVDEAADEAEGTVVVVATDKHTRSRVYGFGARNETARAWVTSWSLANLWRMLRDLANDD